MTPQNGMFCRVHPENALFLFPVQSRIKTAGRLAVAGVLLAIITDALVLRRRTICREQLPHHLTGRLSG